MLRAKGSTLRRLRLAGALLLASCGGGEVSEVGYTPPPPFVPSPLEDLAAHVDPMIGTAGQGNVIPGVLVPHGMLRVSPNTLNEGASIDPYRYEADRIAGFTHTNLEGPGGSGNGYSQILLMPGAGAFDPENSSSAFSHDREQAEPGYYRVHLDDARVDVELAAGARAAIHRYTFDEAGPAHLLFDVGHSQGRSLAGDVRVVGDDVVEGHGQYDVHPVVSFVLRRAGSTAISDVYFYAKLSQPFTRFGTLSDGVVSEGSRETQGAKSGAYVELDVEAGAALELRIGISLISTRQARANLEADVGDASFEELRASTRQLWNEKLNRIRIDADDDVTTMFYTALYHSMFQPANYTEANGRAVVSASGEHREIDLGGRPFYTDDWCMWDTYRTLHPLGTLIEPEIRSDVVRSMLLIYEEGGWLPKCSWNATGYSRVMTGNDAIPIIVDAWQKGLRDFDADVAMDAMRKASFEDVPENIEGLCGYFGLGVPPEYLELGFVGDECDTTQAASMTLEYAYQDSLVGDMAADLGMSELADEMHARGGWYRNQFDTESGFMRPRLRDGSWKTPFDPASNDDFNGFVEANAWIFTFFVPQDVPGLIELLGGRDAFVTRLDEFFDGGFFDVSNEPSFHIPWLYALAGEGDRGSARILATLADSFDTGPGGLPGNDDSGATSAWYVLAAMGIYPVDAGVPDYTLSTPLVRRAEIELNPAYYSGGSIVIERSGAAADARIADVRLNDAPLGRVTITHAELVQGATLSWGM
ncbi:MAG: glycoside hydrolase family 92 protein [Deltaproteobacteria bacterium]|nr:glycoside hydrolase family 92 protein [Deltaproteobacteria bacterium]